MSSSSLTSISIAGLVMTGEMETRYSEVLPFAFSAPANANFAGYHPG
jgi:hypothetical protein